MKYSNINLSLPCFIKISLTCSELSKTIFSRMSLLLEANFKIFSITISLGLSKSSIKFPTDKTEVICKERGSWSSLENIGLSFLLLPFDEILGIETGVYKQIPFKILWTSSAWNPCTYWKLSFFHYIMLVDLPKLSIERTKIGDIFRK